MDPIRMIQIFMVFTNSSYYRSHDCAFFIIVVNGTEIHKYLDHPYWIHKCLSIVRISIFYYIFLYIYFPGIFTELGGLVYINLEAKTNSS